MKTNTLILLLSAFLLTSCGNPLQNKIDKAIKSNPQEAKGYKPLDLQSVKSINIKQALEIALDDISDECGFCYDEMMAEANRNFVSGETVNVYKNRYNYLKGYFEKAQALMDENQDAFNNNYGEVYRLKYNHKVNGELIESFRYFVMDNEKNVIGGPFVEYEDAFELYHQHTLSHVPGYEQLKTSYVPYNYPTF